MLVLPFWGRQGIASTSHALYAVSARTGLRWGPWGVFGQIEPVFWLVDTAKTDDEVRGVVNIGLGGEYLSANGLIRTSLSMGLSILVGAGDLDEPGSTGFYLDLRPAGLRWAVAQSTVIGLEPISLSILVPVLDGIPLVEIQYRTTVVAEYVF